MIVINIDLDVKIDFTSKGCYDVVKLKTTGGSIMSMFQIVFSPTGGTQRVADEIVKEWNKSITKVDLTDASLKFENYTFTKDDVAIIAVPSYGGRVPSLASERISKIKGNQTKCIIVCVYGNRAYEDTLIELNDIVKESGFTVMAAISAIAQHSIINQYATGRPDAKDKEQLQQFSKEIFEKINADLLCDQELHIPGNRPYKKAGGALLVPKANNKCVNCGHCAEVCPANAISKDKIKTADSKKCISCMRCIVECPKSARQVNGVLVSVAALAIKKACSQRKNNELYI